MISANAQELRGVYLVNKKKQKEKTEEGTDGGFDMEQDRFDRLFQHLQIDETKSEGPTVFLVRNRVGYFRGRVTKFNQS